MENQLNWETTLDTTERVKSAATKRKGRGFGGNDEGRLTFWSAVGFRKAHTCPLETIQWNASLLHLPTSDLQGKPNALISGTSAMKLWKATPLARRKDPWKGG
jgi:hypothetical protein